MSGTAHNSLTTVLLLIPMLAVPMLAVFGIPEFSAVIRAPQADAAGRPKSERSVAAFDGLDDVVVEPVDEPGGEATTVAWFDDSADRNAASQLDGPTKPKRPSATPAANRRSREAMVVPAAVHGEPVQALPVYRRTKVDDKVGESQPVSPEQLGESLTWTAAVRRLNQLEIRNFRLERGHLPDQFLFICSYTPADNPRVSYRFEAEADEPLRAVDKVLVQIDKWLATR